MLIYLGSYYVAITTCEDGTTFEKMTAGGWTVLRFQKLSPEKFEKVSISEFELSKFTGI
jgi:hypothetical protein